MKWVCPNCSSENTDTETCYICGAKKPASPVESTTSYETHGAPAEDAEYSDEYSSDEKKDRGFQVAFSDSEAFSLFLQGLFVRKEKVKKTKKKKAIREEISVGEVTAEPEILVSGFAEPWPEHDIAFVSEEISRRKYTGSIRKIVADKKVYEFVRENGTRQLYTMEKAVNAGLATAKKPVSDMVETSGFAKPWKEHRIKFVKSEINRMKFVRMECIEISGKKAYAFYRDNGVKYLYTVEKALNTGLAVRK